MTTGIGYSVVTPDSDGVVDSFDTEAEALLCAVNLVIDAGSNGDATVIQEERDALVEALESIARPERSNWLPGEYPLVIYSMQKIAREALSQVEQDTEEKTP